MKTRAVVLTVIAVGVLLYFFPRLAKAGDSFIFNSPNGDFVRLYSEPCVFSSGWLKLKKASFKYQGKDYEACWMQYQGQVLLIDAAMDASVIPIRAFKKDDPI